ncbi:MAG: hydantoinase B/oxoprolinase family protein [Acidobacteriota bacterium]
MSDGRVRAFIDRGGTFTDVVLRDGDGRWRVAKVLSREGREGEDAILAALKEACGTDDLAERIEILRVGTTVATNALLERGGAPVCFAVTAGFGDLLEIGHQDRPDLFALEIVKTPPLPERVVEVSERLLPDGTVRDPLDEDRLRRDLVAARDAGCEVLAVVLAHGFAHPGHERRVAALGREVGFTTTCCSHDVVPEIGLVSRAETTCAEAHVAPLIRASVDELRSTLGDDTELRFMQSGGGLVRGEDFRGKDAVLSGPAAGAVAVASEAAACGFDRVVGFDMGGTSTDVCRWAADEGLQRVHERVVAGRRLKAPALDIVTVAAGGGSILTSTGRRLRVGPESAGAEPGPACYGRGGPATLTDANVVLGRVRPEMFPRCFGSTDQEPIDPDLSRERLQPLADSVGLSLGEAAHGFVRVAVSDMAEALRQVSVARGCDLREHALTCFGGAGAQHACALADELGIDTVLLHPLAGVFSALGLALADVTTEATVSVLTELDGVTTEQLEAHWSALRSELARRLDDEGIPAEDRRTELDVDLRYRGTEESVVVSWTDDAPLDPQALARAFEDEHRRLFGFAKDGTRVELVTLRGRAHGRLGQPEVDLGATIDPSGEPTGEVEVGFLAEEGVQALPTPTWQRDDLPIGVDIDGPALIAEAVSTIVVEPGWTARRDEKGRLFLTRRRKRVSTSGDDRCDPVSLAIFARRFMSLAEQMGETLRRVSHSTNIKERRDYSCALFTADGRLVANAPHVPVHLGAMGETVRALLATRDREGMTPGLVLASNDPRHGGSHLPDVTVVSPVHVDGELVAFVGNRGHHADIGGIQPGSMPPFSTTLAEEGCCFHDLALVEDERFRDDAIRELFAAGPHPVRDPEERLRDLQAQVAANASGARLFASLCAERGVDVVTAYQQHVLDDASEATADLLARLGDGEHVFSDTLDDGTRIAVTITIAGGRIRFDFTGTSSEHEGNLNAPKAVTRACVLYVLRCLLGREVPLNDGCLAPVDLALPSGSLLDPGPEAAVCGGNVETSMRLADVLLAALGALAAGQGTMNNLTFGNERFGYYETICGGAGAGPGFAGAHVVHQHLTNTRITDAEVLERRHPVLLHRFGRRRGSGGDGRWPGGDGVVREIEVLEPVEAAILSERRAAGPFGLAGGEAGQAGRNRLLRREGGVEELAGRDRATLEAGDRLVIETPGGGGHGEP